MPDDTPDYPVAQVTAGRAERYYALLCRFGIDHLLDDETAASTPSVEMGKPQGVGSGDEAPEQQAEIALDIGNIFREIAEGGALTELADIVIDLPDGADPADVPLDALQGAVGKFGRQSIALIGSVLNFDAIAG